MPVIKNTGTCPFDVAGVIIPPKRSAEVSDEQYEAFTSNPAGKAIAKENFKVLGESAAVVESDEESGDAEDADLADMDKPALVKEAEKLGIKVNKNFGEKKIRELIAAKLEEEADDADEGSEDESDEESGDAEESAE